jgi:hypothetical protein
MVGVQLEDGLLAGLEIPMRSCGGSGEISSGEAETDTTVDCPASSGIGLAVVLLDGSTETSRQVSWEIEG